MLLKNVYKKREQQKKNSKKERAKPPHIKLFTSSPIKKNILCIKRFYKKQ